MTRTGIPYLDLRHNPGGFGCSATCLTCWARPLAARLGPHIACDAGPRFAVHLHAERLRDPIRRRKPATIGVQFTGELFDPLRPAQEVHRVLGPIRKAPQHVYVFLTQRPDIMAAERFLGAPAEWARPNWFCGVTARTQAELDRRMGHMARIHHPKWLSAEPMRGPMDLRKHLADLRGVVIGCDNDPKAAKTAPQWIRAMTRQCEAAAVPVYVKQIRATRGRLLTDPREFPADLAIRELPWPADGKPGGWDHYRDARTPGPPQPFPARREIPDPLLQEPTP